MEDIIKIIESKSYCVLYKSFRGKNEIRKWDIDLTDRLNRAHCTFKWVY